MKIWLVLLCTVKELFYIPPNAQHNQGNKMTCLCLLCYQTLITSASRAMTWGPISVSLTQHLSMKNLTQLTQILGGERMAACPRLLLTPAILPQPQAEEDFCGTCS